MTDLSLMEGEADHGFGQEFQSDESSRLTQFADATGDISDLLRPDELSQLGIKVCEDYDTDDQSRDKWRRTVENALEKASQEKPELSKDYPWQGASNVDYPLLTVAAQQFNARAYPAIVKGDEAVGIKVFGDKPAPLPPSTQGASPEQVAQLKSLFDQNQQWSDKEARAKRVKTYLNYLLFYVMDGWEESVDDLLTQLPIAGTAFKKVYYDPMRGTCSEYVSPLKLCVNMETRALKRAPRITQDFELYPYEIRQRMRAGVYREVTLTQESDDDEAPRVILEQHRLDDLDKDGVDEPYIVTVDKATQQILRIEAAYDEDDILMKGNKVVEIKRYVPFVKFPFIRDPQGRFYEIGFGQLLGPLTDVIDTSINELLDAGHAQVAGGGFIASGMRLQNPGQSSKLQWRPGEYKVVNSPSQDIRTQIWERTLPNPSPIVFQLLEMMMTGAKEIANIKDVLTGEAPSNAPVGTTLALIDQSLQPFSALYKRVYAALKEEFQLIYRCEAKWGGERSRKLYKELLDDPQADFDKDFSQAGMDITPISDPTVVTRQQKLAKAQVMQQTATAFPNVANQAAISKRIYEAADIDNPEELIVQPQPPPGMAEDIENKKADTAQKASTAQLNQAKAVQVVAETGIATGEAHQQGLMDGLQATSAGDGGGPGGVASPSGVPMDSQGLSPDGGGSEAGVDGQLVGSPSGGPAAPQGTGDAG